MEGESRIPLFMQKEGMELGNSNAANFRFLESIYEVVAFHAIPFPNCHFDFDIGSILRFISRR